MDTSAKLAKLITRKSSKQTYYTALLMVDRDLIGDFFRAYAYFRWVDDFIDISANTHEEGIGFIERQKALIDNLYNGDTQSDLDPHEQMAADLVRNDRTAHSGLQSFIQNMMAIIEFDAKRKNRLITEEELDWYTEHLGFSVTDGIQYFVGNGHPYPRLDDQYLAATAAHVTHLLRDMWIDIQAGFINIPAKILRRGKLEPEDFHHPDFQNWVRGRVELAHRLFVEGKRYLDRLDILRCKIVGYWYCARFEGVLKTIERDGYVLREAYHDRKRLSAWLQMLWIWLRVSLQHVYSKQKSELSR